MTDLYDYCKNAAPTSEQARLDLVSYTSQTDTFSYSGVPIAKTAKQYLQSGTYGTVSAVTFDYRGKS